MPVGEAGQGDDESCSYPEEKTAGGKTEPHITLLQLKNYNSGDKRVSQIPSKTLLFLVVGVTYVHRHNACTSEWQI